MAKLILLILTVGFAIAEEPVLKIKDKLYTLVPEIPKDYSITAGIHSPSKETQAPVIPIKSEAKKPKELKPVENTLSKEKEEEEKEESEIRFEDFHKITFQATQNYELYNVNDGSVIDSKGKIITQTASPTNSIKGSEIQNNWGINQNTDQTINNQPNTPQNQPSEIETPFIQPSTTEIPETPFMQPPTTETVTSENSAEVLTKIPLKTNLRVISETSWVEKIGFSLMVGISVLIIMLSNRKEKNRSAYIPTNDDEHDTFN